ncbi:hypothetical protein ACWC5I_48520 [Kitasatospora sp. NPDC001574]
MAEQMCGSCSGQGMRQVEKLTEVTNPDGSKSYISSTTMETCQPCGGRGKITY